ncbi:hypothetical protein Tco_0531893 [Tanacetum coccineum]
MARVSATRMSRFLDILPSELETSQRRSMQDVPIVKIFPNNWHLIAGPSEMKVFGINNKSFDTGFIRPVRQWGVQFYSFQKKEGSLRMVFTDRQSNDKLSQQEEGIEMRQRRWLELLVITIAINSLSPGKKCRSDCAHSLSPLRGNLDGKLEPRTDGTFCLNEELVTLLWRFADVSCTIIMLALKAAPFEALSVENVLDCLLAEVGGVQLTVSRWSLRLDDNVMLRFRLERVVRFGKRGKLNPDHDREVKPLKRSRIPLVKVRWNSRRGPEFTWEREDQLQKKYPHLFTKTAPSSSAAS